jgi:hypothetical protein
MLAREAAGRDASPSAGVIDSQSVKTTEAGGDTHHYQLTRAFRNIGANIRLEDEEFGEPAELCNHLDAETAHFVRLAERLYSRSLGPWCAVEVMSVDWMKALAEAFAVHFPEFVYEPYFEDCSSQHVEERHAGESLAVTELVLKQRLGFEADKTPHGQ